MKKVYKVRESLKFQGEKDFNNCHFFCQYVYKDESEATEAVFVINTFENLCALIEKGLIINAYMSKTFFKKQPKAVITRWYGIDSYKTGVTKKNFIPIECKFSYEDESRESINFYKENLTADDFCEYLKDRGITYLA